MVQIKTENSKTTDTYKILEQTYNSLTKQKKFPLIEIRLVCTDGFFLARNIGQK